MQAIEAGKHIHFNKTMTTTAEEATQLIDAAAAKNVTLVASPGRMIRSSNKRIRKLIQDGVLGQPPGRRPGRPLGTLTSRKKCATARML